MRILVVEDERKVAGWVGEGVGEEGHTVEVSADGAEALELLLAGPPYDLVVLDLMLPGRDGVTVLRTARARGVRTRVLVLTARDSVADRVTGLDLGADDYLTKPFAFEEFLARVRALLRRPTLMSALLKVSDLTLDPVRHEAKRGGRIIQLTWKEFALLEYLMRNKGRVLSRTKIFDHIWGDDLDTSSNVVDVYISYLRDKIDKNYSPKLIHTVRNVGYVLRED